MNLIHFLFAGSGYCHIKQGESTVVNFLVSVEKPVNVNESWKSDKHCRLKGKKSCKTKHGALRSTYGEVGTLYFQWSHYLFIQES